MADETSSLLPPGGESKNFYFLSKRKSNEGIEMKPSSGATEQSISVELKSHFKDTAQTATPPPQQSSWWTSLFRKSSHPYQLIDGAATSKPRAVPVKIEPKVFFANERTFLSWLHMSVTLASISVAIVAFAEANEWSQIYGLLLLPVAIAFCIYSLYMYIKRANMIRRKDPGPYEERIGPIALAVMLATAILLNFAVKLYDYAT